MYPQGTSKGLLLMYRISRLCDVPGWVASYAAEPRDVCGSVASGSGSEYKAKEDPCSLSR